MRNQGHVVIIGLDDFALQVAKQIVTAGKSVVLVSNEKSSIDHHTENNFTTDELSILQSEYNDFPKIEEAGVNDALAVLINLQKDTEKLKYVIQFNKYFKSKQTVVPINDASLKETFSNVGVRYPLSKNEIAAKVISSFLFEKDVALYCKDLIASAEDESDYDIQQYMVLKVNPFCGMKYGEAFENLRNEYNAVLIGLSKCSQTPLKRALLKNPSASTLIDEGDYLIVVLNGESADKLKTACEVDEGVVL